MRDSRCIRHYGVFRWIRMKCGHEWVRNMRRCYCRLLLLTTDGTKSGDNKVNSTKNDVKIIGGRRHKPYLIRRKLQTTVWRTQTYSIFCALMVDENGCNGSPDPGALFIYFIIIIYGSGSQCRSQFEPVCQPHAPGRPAARSQHETRKRIHLHSLRHGVSFWPCFHR